MDNNFYFVIFFIDRLINYSFQLSMNEVELNRMKKYTFFFLVLKYFNTIIILFGNLK